MDSLVSVVIPTYGGPDFLKRAVDSFLEQTYKNIEIIVVDDNGVGSDNQKQTSQVMQSYLDNPRVTYICHTVNKNGSAARNTGVKNSKGDFLVLFDDDDDCCVLSRVERQVHLLSGLSNDVAAVYCSHLTFFEGKCIEEIRANVSGNLLFETLVHSVEIATSSLMIRRSVYEELNGFDEDFRRHQDWEFVSRMAYKYKIVADDFVGYHRYLTWRNAPREFTTARLYRELYLRKMKPYISSLGDRKAQEVYLSNQMEVALYLLKDKKIVEFLKECYRLGGGLYLIKFLCIRLYRRIGFFVRNRK